MEQITPVEKAARIVGGLTVLARMVGVSAPTVYEWKVLKRPVPAVRCTAIEQATGGRVSRKELRPHDWMDIWPELVQGKDAQPNRPAAQYPREQVAPETIATTEPWDGVERRNITSQAIDPEHGRREIDRPGAFPLVEGA